MEFLKTSISLSGFFYALAIVSGYILTTQFARMKDLDTGRVQTICLISILSGLIGTKVYFILSHINAFISDSDLNRWFLRTGSGSYGTYIGGFLGAWGAAALLKVDYLTFADSCSPAVAFGIFIGKIGCFFNGCCFGKATAIPWAVTYPQVSFAFASHVEKGLIDASSAHSLPVHPVQLYESFFALILFVFLIFVFRRSRLKGRIFFLFAMLYAFGRFWTEIFRGDHNVYLLDLSIPRWFSVAIFFGGIWFSFYLRRRNPGHY